MKTNEGSSSICEATSEMRHIINEQCVNYLTVEAKNPLQKMLKSKCEL